MEKKCKLYPYPVLSSYTNDYRTSSFDVDISIENEIDSLCVEFSPKLNCRTLQDCINRGDASFVYQIECSQTGFREVIKTVKDNEKYLLSSKKINGDLEVRTYIVATKDLKGFTSPDFHEDYQKITFDIETACVLALGKTLTIQIKKEICTNTSNSAESIFSISKNVEEDDQRMQYDMEQQKIIIKLPKKSYQKFKEMNKKSELNPHLKFILYHVLTHILEQLKTLTPEMRLSYTDRKWYGVLEKKLSSQFGCDIASDDYDDFDCFDVARKLLDFSIDDVFECWGG